jgi:hypothetical protein
LTIESCETTGEGRSLRTYCTGHFTSADGTVVNEFFGAEDNYRVGAVLPRQREAANMLAPVGWGAAALSTAAALGSVVLIGAGMAAVANVSRRHPTERQRLERDQLAVRGRTLYPLPPLQRRAELVGWSIAAAGLVGAVAMLCVRLLV